MKFNYTVTKTMSSILLSLPELFNSYKNWVSKNPQISSEYETCAKWLSYFIAGRINNSHVVSELVYCLSNMLVLFNDGIIRKKLNLNIGSQVEKIKIWLSVVEYSEVFCELSVEKLWGHRAKWITVVVIQVFKCIARLLLVYKHKEPVIENPPIMPLDRSKCLKDNNDNSMNITELNQTVSFTLKRSGRVIRKIESSPPMALRTWKPLEVMKSTLNDIPEDKPLDKYQLIAETIYISKPLIHLTSLALYGSQSWKPWMLSLGLDLSSLQLHKASQKISMQNLSKKQQLQFSKRSVLLILYLIRTPFYENYSGNKVNALLAALSNNVPLVKIICNPLLQYLPFWQSNYFHMWST